MSETLAVHTYFFPTEIHSGPGARRRLPKALHDAGVRRPLVVTDAALAKLPVIDDVVGLLREAGLGAQVFSGIAGNPVVSQVTTGVGAVREADADGIVAVGGGAALDVAKCIALMVHHPGTLLEYEDGRPKARPIDRDIPFLAALPTTAGTGSEVGRSAVVSEDDTHVKRIVFSPRLLPKVVFADAELTLGLPASVTAATGMDALTHAIEAYVAKGHHPICDGVALEAIHIVAQHLARAVELARAGLSGAPRDEHLRVRQAMLEAAMMGAIAFQKGLGVTHSCAHALSTVCDLHHGLANGVLLPYAMEFNLAAVPDRFAQMAQVAGLDQPGPDAFVSWLADLKARIGIPRTLAEVNVAQGHCERLVEVALQDGCHQLNPRPVSRDDFHALFSRAIAG